ncbi:MAG: ImmA/IrrE family metallo-endopeptidase [Cyanobacteria bacterium]|nr:ImmA/IrrE family metallo-endopeptidase [Cyanobacteriota bacterium]
MDEFSVVLKARQFIDDAGATGVPVRLEPYLKAARASSRELTDMAADEAGTCFPMSDGSYRICVNANDSIERRRFTICHEIAHIVLRLNSDHRTHAWTSSRPLPERLCDLFAAELLLPAVLFKPAAEAARIGLASIDALAKTFEASMTATGSRYADSITTPCAFVLSHQGKVVHASRSKALRDARAIIPRHMELPCASISALSRAGTSSTTGEIDAADWFDAWERGGTLLEESRHLSQWDQTLTLLWFASEEVPSLDLTRRARRWESEGREVRDRRDDEDEFGLKELDGHLRWPGRSRRR